MKIPLVYVAGPYRANTPADVDTNIMQAREVGKIVARCGAYPVIPHANTAHFDGIDLDWLAGTLELCRRCDAIVLMPMWRLSVGTKGERSLMLRLERPEFYVGSTGWEAALRMWAGDFSNQPDAAA